MVRVSLIIPVYNGEKYLEECLDSAIGQTLPDIEIICVNDGSYDASCDIIRRYMEADRRIRLIDKENGGYGSAVNAGLDAARGEYVAILEADDFAEPDMLARLYNEARENSLDIAKGGFFLYRSAPERRDTPHPVLTRKTPRGVFCPTEGLSLKTAAAVFGIMPSVWSAIYRAEFLKQSGIRFSETPGASFQDLSFTFIVLASAARVKLLPHLLVHYRQDNGQSSVNSTTKALCVTEEYRRIERFISGRADAKTLNTIKCRMMLDTYIWNYRRLSRDAAGEFAVLAAQELRREAELGHYRPALYPWYRRLAFGELLADPKKYHLRREREASKKRCPVSVGMRSIRENGFGYAIRRLLRRI